MKRFVCVDDQKAAGFPVTAACEAAGVSTSGYYDWSQREAAGPTERQLAEAELVALMRQLFDQADGNYGVPRMYKALRHAGLVVNPKRVVGLMRRHAMAGRCRRRRCRTTFPGPDGYQIPDLLGRRFEPGAPDVAWCQDITYIATAEGWLYMASVIDLGSRRLLGYSMAGHMRTELVLDALKMAVAARGGEGAVGRRDRPRGPRFAVHVERLHRLLPGPEPPDAALGRNAPESAGTMPTPSRSGKASSENAFRAGLHDPSRGPPGNLQVDQLVQHVEASQHPQGRRAARVGTAVPPSVITTRPANGEMPTPRHAGTQPGTLTGDPAPSSSWTWTSSYTRCPPNGGMLSLEDERIGEDAELPASMIRFARLLTRYRAAAARRYSATRSPTVRSQR